MKIENGESEKKRCEEFQQQILSSQVKQFIGTYFTT